MGRVIQVVSMIGILILIAIVIVGIVALTTGHFDPSFRNPPT